MYWTFENFRSPDYILITAGGNFTDTGFVSMLDELFQQDYWRPRIPLLLDETDMDATPVAVEQLINTAEHFLGLNSRLAYTRIAVVLGSPEAMRVAHRFGHAVNSETKAVVEVFLDKEKAVGWLLV